MDAILCWAAVVVVCGLVLNAVHEIFIRIANKNNWGRIYFYSLKPVAKVVPVLLWCAVVFSPLYYELPNFHGNILVEEDGNGYSSIPVTFEGGRIKKHPYGLFIWEWSKKYSNLPIEKIAVGSGVTPITANPKARKINYIVNVAIISPEKYYRLSERWQISSLYVADMVKQLVDYHLYEFNNFHSNELGELYNPLDEKQQERFQNMLKGYLDARLAPDGIEVANARFSLE